jgi:hypothetical protein
MSTTAVSTLNPSLALDIVSAVQRANLRGYPNSGQVAVLNAVAVLQMANAANTQPWAVTRAAVRSLTGLSESTVRNHFKFWVQRGALTACEHAFNPAVIITLEA